MTSVAEAAPRQEAQPPPNDSDNDNDNDTDSPVTHDDQSNDTFTVVYRTAQYTTDYAQRWLAARRRERLEQNQAAELRRCRRRWRW